MCSAYQRLTKAQRSNNADDIDILCQQTETLNSPPPTPRFEAVPNTSRVAPRHTIPVAALPPLKAHWPSLEPIGQTSYQMSFFEQGKHQQALSPSARMQQ